jgi:predicted enzyme related to lactoylglutathione lyase
MTLKWEEVVVDCLDPATLGRWWAEALGWEIIDEEEEILELKDPNASGPTVLFGVVPESKTIKNRLHFDFVPDDQDAEVARLEAMGARRIDIGQGETPWVVMADPEGNEFCILSARP